MQKITDWQTEDGNTKVYAPEIIKVTNGTLTDNEDGTASLSISGGAETDPVVKAINGIVKSNGSAISAAEADTDYLTPTTASTTYAPIGAKYIVQQADGSLTNEQALGALATGIVKNTTTTGVLSIATDGTDYLAPTRIDDTKGNGDTGYTWSADKNYDQLALKSPIDNPTFTTAITTPKVIGSGGALELEDSAALNIDVPGTAINFANATKPVKSIYLSAAGAVLPTSSYAEIQDFAGTNFTYRVLAFDQSADEKCFWHFPIPDNFTGTTVTITAYWTANSGTNTRGVSWKFDSGGFADDEAFNTGALGGTEIEIEDAKIASGDMHIATSGAFTCDWTAGDYAVFYCYRDVDAYSGTNLDADALLIGVKIEYTISELSQ
ncbi:MAG: hypothetical protein WC312_03795 [Candidatus Omnitrophota bacterium]